VWHIIILNWKKITGGYFWKKSKPFLFFFLEIKKKHETYLYFIFCVFVRVTFFNTTFFVYSLPGCQFCQTTLWTTSMPKSSGWNSDFSTTSMLSCLDFLLGFVGGGICLIVCPPIEWETGWLTCIMVVGISDAELKRTR